MSFILKELSNSKGFYTEEFKCDSIPIYFPPTKFPEHNYLIKSRQGKQGYTDVCISGKLGGMPGDRKVSNLSMCYKPFRGAVAPEIKERLKMINQETDFSLNASGAILQILSLNDGVFIQQLNKDEKIPINSLISFLEKIEGALVENISYNIRRDKIDSK